MSEDLMTSLLRLRLVVGYLGEKSQLGWWQTDFFNQNSAASLRPLFPRTSRLAQYHGVVEAARLLHDEHLSVGSYHLFRLPEEIEQDLHALAKAEWSEGEVGSNLASASAAQEALTLAGTKKVNVAPGPSAVGNIRDLAAPETRKVVAGLYHVAFSQNIRIYPYLLG